MPFILFNFKRCQSTFTRSTALWAQSVSGEEPQSKPFLLTWKPRGLAGHGLVLSELGQSWELEESQILWYWAWQASHTTLVLRRYHNVSKKINSERQRLLTIHWVVQEQKPHKNDHFLLNTQPTWRQRNLQKFPATCQIKLYAKSQWWSLLLKSHLQIYICFPPLLLIIVIYKYSRSLTLAQEALQFLSLFLPYVVGEYCHKVVHHAYLTEGSYHSCDSTVRLFPSFT